ncbi:MAG: cystathionine beta-lyase [Rhizomicrobium sp.]
MSHKPSTLIGHLGREPARYHGAVSTPVYRVSTFLMPDLETLEDGTAPYVYGRRGTPTSESFTTAINALEQGAATVVTPSGLAAITTAILAVCRAGDHLLVSDSAYFPTRNFCDRVLARYGVQTSYFDPCIGNGIDALFRSNTRAVFCESPGSLTFEIQDIPAIADVAHRRGASVLMDNTWATPLYFQPLAHGIDLSIQSVTKYIGGHSDLMMGYVCANPSHAERLTHTHGDLGLFASADDLFLALRGLRTLSRRLPVHEQNGLKLARWFSARPEVARVLHPGLDSDPGHAIWKRDFKGACGLFAIELKPLSHAALAAFMDGLKLFGMGWSWGGFESLITPAHIVRTARPWPGDATVVRVHAGLEDVDDLIADLSQGFERMARQL